MKTHAIPQKIKVSRIGTQKVLCSCAGYSNAEAWPKWCAGFAERRREVAFFFIIVNCTGRRKQSDTGDFKIKRRGFSLAYGRELGTHSEQP